MSTNSAMFTELQTRGGAAESVASISRVDFSRTSFPSLLAVSTLIACLLPLLYWFDVRYSVASISHPFNIESIVQWQLSPAHLIDQIFYTVSGGIEHALLEWTAVVLALLCVVIAFSHYSISNDAVAPVIGMALFMSGGMDMFHTLAATRLIDAVAENTNLIPFTWAISRGGNALLLFLGLVILLANKKKYLRIKLYQLILGGLLIFAAAYTLTNWMALSENLPKTQFPNNFFTRPYDVLPMVIFCLCIPLGWRLYKLSPSYLTATLFISLFADAFCEAYMAFGSTALFDHYFNSAHTIKILGFALPFVGYLLDYQQIFISKIAQEEELKNSNQALKQAELHYRTINQMMPVGLMLVNDKGSIVEANDQAASIFGYFTEEISNMNVDQLVPDAVRSKHASLRESYSKDRKSRSMAKGNSKLVGMHKSGRRVPLEIGLAPILLSNTHYVVVSITDISDRIELIEVLEHKNTEMDIAIDKLTRSNEQLERFAYVCSHDLQEPVRMVLSFSQLLDKNINDQLDGKNKEYLSYITNGAIQTRDMISDILQFCSLEQSSESREMVSLGMLCKHVKETLGLVLKERNAILNCPEGLPEIPAVRSQLFQIVLNLVSNGLKFNKSSVPEISISVDDDDSHWRIMVQDNGIVIDKKYQSKLFTMFSRLHSKTEFPGTGLGLAICKKAAENNGATFSIDSAPGEGSCFMLRWPKEL